MVAVALVLGGTGTALYFYANHSPIAVQASPSKAREDAAISLMQCLQVFRQIGEKMSIGQEPDMNLRCAPHSGANRLERNEDTIRISHTNPQLFIRS